MYQAELLCSDCGEVIRANLDKKGRRPADPDDESSYDSGDYPKGPYGNGGGESDSPQHCGACGVFLENPLTQDGYRWLADTLSDPESPSDITREWADFYDMERAYSA